MTGVQFTFNLVECNNRNREPADHFILPKLMIHTVLLKYVTLPFTGDFLHRYGYLSLATQRSTSHRTPYVTHRT